MSWAEAQTLSVPKAAPGPSPAVQQARVRRFHCRLEQTVPPQLALPPVSVAGLAAILGILADSVEAVSADVLRIERVSLPAPLRLRTTDLRWRCEAGLVEGAGVLELGAWLTDRDLIDVTCMLRLAVAGKGRH